MRNRSPNNLRGLFDNAQTQNPTKDDSYQKSTEFVLKPEDIDKFETWPKTGPTDVQGMVKPGTIDLTKRPIVHHPDGSVSSLYSGSVELDGKILLLPGVSTEGKMLTTPKSMVAEYKKTGNMLGQFKTEDDASAYAEMLHNKQGAFQTWKNGGKYNPTVETWDDWKEPQ